MEDESGEFLGDRTDVTGSHVRRAVGRASIVAWVLFGLTAGVLAVTSVVLARRYSDVSTRLENEVNARADLMVKVSKKDAEVTAAVDRAAKAEDALKTVTADRDQLADKLKVALAAQAKAAPAPAPVKKKPAPVRNKPLPKKKH